MHIVILDGKSLNDGISPWNSLSEFGTWEEWESTDDSHFFERTKNADILIINKAKISKERIENLPSLKLIAVTATGTNTVDIAAAVQHNIPVCNTPNYGASSVAQHTLALLLEICRHVGLHNESVHRGDWGKCTDFCYNLTQQIDLTDLTMGILGFGNIGSRTAELAHAFGMKVIACSHTPKPAPFFGNFSFVTIQELFKQSDVIALHCPLTQGTYHIINKDTISLMKHGTFILNTARGPLVNTRDMYDALVSGQIGAYAADVLEIEPPKDGNILFHAPNAIITPHIAWATKKAKQNIVNMTVENIRLFLKGTPQNLVTM